MHYYALLIVKICLYSNQFAIKNQFHSFLSAPFDFSSALGNYCQSGSCFYRNNLNKAREGSQRDSMRRILEEYDFVNIHDTLKYCIWSLCILDIL